MDLDLLLARADDRRPVLEGGLPEGAAYGAPKPDLQLPPILLNKGRDPDSLSQQRWAIVRASTDEGRRLLQVIDPLRRLRQEEQGDPPIQVFEVPPGMNEFDTIDWIDNRLHAGPIEDWPLYLLILGDFDGVSLEFQQTLAADHIVGRIAFPADAGYEAYVAKVKRWYETPYTETSARAILYTARDRTPATEVGYSSLMQPSLERCTQRLKNGTFSAKEILELAGAEPSPSELLEQVKKAEPTILFSMSHGLGAPRGGWKSADEQRALQGAMGFGEGGRIAGEDIKEGAFLPGGVWFYLACYGGGTPASSVYLPWLKQLREDGAYSGRVDAVAVSLPKAGDRPFVASLPQSALANPDGPLAVIAHVDLAWTYSFQDTGAQAINRVERFQGIFQQLLDRKRAGLAHRELTSFGTAAAVDLAMRYGADEAGRGRQRTPEEEAARRVRRANLWMLRHDLLGYILLGDPAVRVPFSEKTAAATAAPAARDYSSFFGFDVKGPTPIVQGGKIIDMNGAEKVVREAVQPKAKVADIAKRYNVPKADLDRWVAAYTKAGRAELEKL